MEEINDKIYEEVLEIFKEAQGKCYCTKSKTSFRNTLYNPEYAKEIFKK